MNTNLIPTSGHPPFAFKDFTPAITWWLVLVFSILFAHEGFSQRTGFTDTFDDGSLELSFRGNQGTRPPLKIWGTITPATYGLVEKDSVLTIRYFRREGSGAFDHFTFSPFRALNVASNPRIQVQIRSTVETRLTLSPIYSLDPPTCEYLEQTIAGDKAWHTYTFDLSPAYYSRLNTVGAVDFYFDRNTSLNRSGKIEMDNFKIAWFLIKVTDVTATVEDGSNIRLNWKASDPARARGYKIYRATQPGFQPSESNLLTESMTSTYLDENLEPYHHYFYQIVPVGTTGEVFFASKEVNGETYQKGAGPTVKIKGTNAQTIKKYEKFEVLLDLDHVGIENPFDPADIDVYVLFTAPSGKKMKINAFYDNYQDAHAWKLRFSPNETGMYSYQVFVNDAGGKGETSVQQFKATTSEHHGWIKPSVKNPHYFVQDDGSSFYGVGVYSPWGNDQSRLDTYASNNANLFAIWDIGYGGFVNDQGLIEEELGRYNQKKLGKLDSLIVILEKSEIKLMYALWPHDLFSETVWAAEWKKNPYSQLIDVADVYKDSLVWEFQKKKYRYLIARYSYSRSMGIWELINEMNGTDGWAKGRHQEALDWVAKCDRYFEENDPYNHPVTASFSGGLTEYREELYKRTDIPNIHIYPAQGWPLKYPDDKMRSDMYNFAWASRRFWDAFEKPAIFGEAGADLTYFKPTSPEYHISYHNQIWAALTNGLSSTPVWWAYDNLNGGDWSQLKHLSKFVSDIDFANQPFQPSTISCEGADVFGLNTGSNAIGWCRSFARDNVSGSSIKIQGLEDSTYELLWFDAWKGEYLQATEAVSKNGQLVITVPSLSVASR
ncbi:MAG TPA: DUF5060 domain-containing protein, partial [Prolixibacteraceae bacterium]